MRGDVIVVAVGLVVALAFSMLITAFTTYIINPIVAAAGGKNGNGLGFYVSDHNPRRTWTSASSSPRSSTSSSS
jgi:large conductance mechanosensitive channel